MRTRLGALSATLASVLSEPRYVSTSSAFNAAINGAQKDIAESEGPPSEAPGCANGTMSAGGKCLRRDSALPKHKTYKELNSAERRKLMGQLRIWARFVRGNALNYTCRNASVPRRLKMHGPRGYGTFDADAWHVCYDGWKPWESGCLGVSIGIGGEWGFEDGLAQSTGCHVHAYDPTEELKKQHSVHAAQVSRHFDGRMHFEAVGLGGETAQANTAGIRYGHFDQSAGNIKTLGSIMASATQGRRTPIVDVLKIDCEGCEWTAFQEVEKNEPRLLSRVRIIMLEVHSIKRYGLNGVTQVHQLLSHLVHGHGFRVYKSGFNKGWKGARNQIQLPLVQAGFPGMPCCWLLQLMRPPEDNAWLAEAARAAGT